MCYLHSVHAVASDVRITQRLKLSMVSFVSIEKSPSQEVVFILHPLCFGIRGVWLGMVFADLLLAPALPWQVCWRRRGEIDQPSTNDEPT